MSLSGCRKRMIRILVELTSVALVIATGACSGQAGEKPAATASSKPDYGSVAIFTPSDGITLTQHTPLNKWAAFAPDLKTALEKRHIEGSKITRVISSSLEDQSKDLQDYVVSHLVDDNKTRKAASPTTLVIAPFTSPDSVTRQYGDYVSQPLPVSAGGKKKSNTADPGVSNKTESGQGTDSTGGRGNTDEKDQKEEEEEERAYDRLISSIKLAKTAGMHVVLLSNDLPDISPDLFVDMSDAKSIGEIQASKLASKLELNKASRGNPVRIEVLLPDSSSEDLSEREKDEEADSFPSQAFSGIWKVLGPYFKDGRAISPSGLLTSQTSEDDWRAVTFDPGKDTSGTKKELMTRLSMGSQAKTHTRIDGVLAMNDYIVSGIVSELNDLGYTGTAADINPDISISGIVGSMRGKQDLHRKKVPKPAQVDTSNLQNQNGTNDHLPGSSTSQNGLESTSGSGDEDRPSWPIISGYGAYVDAIPQIVDGEQWMTAIEDRKGLAEDVAAACYGLNLSGTLPSIQTIGQATISGRKVNRLTRPLVAVSASNLKSTLIDTNYIKPADAGL